MKIPILLSYVNKSYTQQQAEKEKFNIQEVAKISCNNDLAQIDATRFGNNNISEIQGGDCHVTPPARIDLRHQQSL